MNTKIKYGILTFVICFVLGTVVPVTIGTPGEDPNSTIERLRQDPNLIGEILHRAVENAKKGNRKEIHSIVQSIGKPYNIYTSDKLLPDYISFLNDKDGEVQVLGATCLCSLKSPKSVDALVKYLKSKDFGKLEKMVSAGEFTEQDRLCYLWAAPVAIWALGRIGDKSVIPFLESLRSIDFHLEWDVGPVEEALAMLGPEGIRILCNLGPKADDRQISRAANELQGVCDPNMAPVIIEIVKNANCAERIRLAAMDTLGNFKGVDILPFILATIMDANQPNYLRGSAAIVAGRTHQSEAEKALLKLLDDPNCDIRTPCLYGLAKLNPDRILMIILDKSAPLSEREQLSDRMANAMEPKELTPHAEMLRKGIKAIKEDGSPADTIRVYMWMSLHKATGEEPPLELMDVRIAYDELRFDFETKFTRENVYASVEEIRRMVDEKIKSIVVKWQPQKVRKYEKPK